MMPVKHGLYMPTQPWEEVYLGKRVKSPVWLHVCSLFLRTHVVYNPWFSHTLYNSSQKVTVNAKTPEMSQCLLILHCIAVHVWRQNYGKWARSKSVCKILFIFYIYNGQMTVVVCFQIPAMKSVKNVIITGRNDETGFSFRWCIFFAVDLIKPLQHCYNNVMLGAGPTLISFRMTRAQTLFNTSTYCVRLGATTLTHREREHCVSIKLEAVW